MPKTFVIAECASSHDNDIDKAKRLIDWAKECGADAAKFQWTSNGSRMAQRRGQTQNLQAADLYGKFLQKPVSWLETLKAHADKVGIEFMCTVFLIEDIDVIAPFVSKFKVSAREADWTEFVQAHFYRYKETIISSNDALNYQVSMKLPGSARPARVLHCVSKYPTPWKDVCLDACRYDGVDGLSDHSTNPLAGALAVAAGARIIEKHIKLVVTSHDNPDWAHSMTANCHSLDMQGDWGCEGHADCFYQYVRMIREAEVAFEEDSAAPILVSPPVSAEQLSHRPGWVVYDPSGDLPAGSLGAWWQEPQPPDTTNSPQGGPRV